MMIRLRVKEVATRLGIKQTKLARHADISYDTMRDIYTGKANIQLDTLDKIARTLRVHPSELIEYIEEPPPALF